VTRTKRYLSNVLWSWSGVLLTIVVGFLLSPYLIRHLGDINFGIWAVATSLVGYYWLMDLGFRSATIKMSAEFRATGEGEKLNELLSTGVVYASLAGLAILAATWTAAPVLARWYKFERPEFVALVRMVGASFAIGLTFNSILSSCLEGFQRFDLTTRVWLTLTIVRSVGIYILIRLGHGVLEMGYMLLGAQLMSYAMTYWLFRQAVPGARLSVGRARLKMLRAMASYGIHTFTSSVSNLLLNRSVVFLIPRMLGIGLVPYFTVPVSILEYATDGIGRIGMVTTPNATELMAKGEPEGLVDLAVYANRYSFVLFGPVAIFLMTYGPEFFGLWIRKSYAVDCGQLLPVLLLGQFIMAGQQNSVSVLFGIGRHQTYARCLLAEAVLMTVGVVLMLPRGGLVGAAWVVSIMMALNRGAGVCWLVSKELKISPFRYAWRIYAIPLAITLGVWIALGRIKAYWIPGHTWWQLIAAGAIMGVVYSFFAFRFSLSRRHRERILGMVREALFTAETPRTQRR
jgi:O-antigen/teichoic acid export membrane protein